MEIHGFSYFTGGIFADEVWFASLRTSGCYFLTDLVQTLGETFKRIQKDGVTGMRQVNTRLYLDQIVDVINEGHETSIPVKGNSMVPFLKENRDYVFLSSVSSDSAFEPGAIYLFTRLDGSYVLHRLHHFDQQYLYMLGDNQRTLEPISPGQIRAKVISVKRNNKMIDSDDTLWKFFAGPWNRNLWMRSAAGILSRIRRRFI